MFSSVLFSLEWKSVWQQPLAPKTSINSHTNETLLGGFCICILYPPVFFAKFAKNGVGRSRVASLKKQLRYSGFHYAWLAPRWPLLILFRPTLCQHAAEDSFMMQSELTNPKKTTDFRNIRMDLVFPVRNNEIYVLWCCLPLRQGNPHVFSGWENTGMHHCHGKCTTKTNKKTAAQFKAMTRNQNITADTTGWLFVVVIRKKQTSRQHINRPKCQSITSV